MISIFYIYQTLHYSYNDPLESYIIYYIVKSVPFLENTYREIKKWDT